MSKSRKSQKEDFKKALRKLANALADHVGTDDRQWTIKGFVDVFRNVYTISADTKIVSKILEIPLFPILLKFAQEHDYRIVLADHQNYYPDLTFVSIQDDSLKFAVDLKTTYRLPDKPGFCCGFTLGSHGAYFTKRNEKKNIQFPYNQYSGHFCLGAIYTRADSGDIDETRVHGIEHLQSIVSVIKDIQFFAREKWEIASDSQGSGNTANIGSIVHIEDLLCGNGMFKNLGEKWFDEYWMNYGILVIRTNDGKKMTKLSEFLEFKGKDPSLLNPCVRSANRKKKGEK